jgi:hypothetical protein
MSDIGKARVLLRIAMYLCLFVVLVIVSNGLNLLGFGFWMRMVIMQPLMFLLIPAFKRCCQRIDKILADSE